MEQAFKSFEALSVIEGLNVNEETKNSLCEAYVNEGLDSYNRCNSVAELMQDLEAED